LPFWEEINKRNWWKSQTGKRKTDQWSERTGKNIIWNKYLLLMMLLLQKSSPSVETVQPKSHVKTGSDESFIYSRFPFSAL
jgi:hypothetical protein